jgi:hypothetical protein
MARRKAMSRARHRGRQLVPHSKTSKWRKILLLEDNSARSERRIVAGVRTEKKLPPIFVRLHEITGVHTAKVLKERRLKSGARSSDKESRSELALDLLSALRSGDRRNVIVAGPTYGPSLFRDSRWCV